MSGASPRPASPPTPPSDGLRLGFASSLVAAGVFRCGPGDWRWAAVNCADDGHLVVFPRTSVVIDHERTGDVVADSTGVLFYNRGDRFRRRQVSPTGDRCVVLVASAGLLDAIAAGDGLTMPAPDARPFPSLRAPSGAATFLAAHRLGTVLLAAPPAAPDGLRVEELAIDIVRASVVRLLAASGDRPRPRRRVSEAMQACVRDAQVLVAEELDEPLTLADLGRAVAASPYHLARAFRAETGLAVHAYRDALRLRAALPAVSRRTVRLTDLALDLGYSSPSHFSARFRQHFGLAPSDLRRAVAMAR